MLDFCVNFHKSIFMFLIDQNLHWTTNQLWEKYRNKLCFIQNILLKYLRLKQCITLYWMCFTQYHSEVKLSPNNMHNSILIMIWKEEVNGSLKRVTECSFHMILSSLEHNTEIETKLQFYYEFSSRISAIGWLCGFTKPN